jgi:putative ABC transport system permease protein
MRLGLREIRRAKGRFALLSGAVGLLVLLLLFFQATAGTLVAALTGGIERVDGDVVVYADRARGNPLASILDPAVRTAVTAVDGVEATGGVAIAPTSVRVRGERSEIVLVGIEPGAPGTPRSVDGALPGAREAIASGSGFEAGYPVGAVVEVGGVPLRVVATTEAAFNAAPTLYVPLETYAEALAARLRPGRDAPLSYLAVRGGDATALAERITAEVAGTQALTRPAAVEALPGIGTIDRSFGVLYLLLFVVVALVTGVFFLILTVQKRDALVLLRAVGAERRDLVSLVLAQVIVVVGVGVAIGTGLAAGLLAAARETIGASLDLGTAVRSGLAVLGLGVVATAGALRRVLAIAPVEATRTGRMA